MKCTQIIFILRAFVIKKGCVFSIANGIAKRKTGN